MITTKKIVFIAALALTSNFAAAATYDLNPLAVQHTDGTATVLEIFTTGVSGLFEDTFTFTIPGSSPSWTVKAIFESSSIGFTDIFVGTVASFIGIPSGIGEPSATVEGIFTPGQYSIIVQGWSGSTGSKYTLNALLSPVSPVPEPSSIALMLGGLGLVGFMAARRRKNT